MEQPRYSVRPTDSGYGAWDSYLLRWVPSAWGRDVDMSEYDAEQIVRDRIWNS